ncbi:MAG: cupredoxin domain-containing protein [Candidatus Saccharibacteria bacterium]
MDPNNLDQSKAPQDLSYQVMPKGSGPLSSPSAFEPRATQTPSMSATPPVVPAQAPSGPGPIPPFMQRQAPQSEPEGPIDNGMLPIEPEHRFGGKILYIIIGIVVLIGLGIAAYLLLGGKDKDANQEQAETTLPKVWLLKNFGSETCADAAKCGDKADPDKDGLSNIDEFHASSNPNADDTDSDGLADGDEVHVYKTDPTIKYYDKREVAIKNDYNDGSQIANSYDPLTPGLKMTAARKEQISKDTATYGLHEPTPTTLQKLGPQTPSAATNPQSYSVHVQATSFNPATISINKGDTIIWLNDDVMKHQIASDPHPGHTGMPGLVSPVLNQNQTYTFRFDATGTFRYHDDLNPALKGTIEVK